MYTAIKAHHSMLATTNAINYISNREKTDLSQYQDRIQNEDPLLIDQHTLNMFDYSTNPNKTIVFDESGEQAQLISGHNCDPFTVKESFQACMDAYYAHHKENLGLQTAKKIFRAKLDGNGDPILDENGEMIYDDNSPVWHDPETGKCKYYHYQKQTQARTSYGWVVSCPPPEVIGYEIDPRIVHQIGREFSEQMFGDQYQCLIATHCDRHHIHNHITSCAYNISGTGKYRDTMDNLLRARHIADDLSLKFGIPISAEVPHDMGKHIDWSEWSRTQKGDSWKDQMRQDISATARIAKSYPQFLEMIQDAGYGIRETDNHLTYIMPGDKEWRCRDVRLGKDFTKTELVNYFEALQEKKQNPDIGITKTIPQEQYVSRKRDQKKITLRVPRYTEKGRRRTDLEMIFLIAVKIIRAIKDLFRNLQEAKEHPDNPIFRDFGWKERQMIDSLKMVQEIGISSKDELDTMSDEIGQRLSVARKEEKELKQDVEYTQKIIDLIDTLKETRAEVNRIGFDMPLHLYPVDEKEVRKNIASEAPATPAQRRNLYMLLQNTDNHFRLSVKYDDISSIEAEQVIQYLQHHSNIKPGILLEGEEKDIKGLENKYEKILNSRLEKEKEKYKEPASEYQKKRVLSIINAEAHDIDNERLLKFENSDIDVDKLTKYDAMQIINYFTVNHTFDSPLCVGLELEKLERLLEREKDTIPRPSEHVTRKELREIEEYYKLIPDRRKYAKKPALLQPYEKPTESNLKQLQELIKLRGITPTVPIEELSKEEVFTLSNYLLKREAVPDCLKESTVDASVRQDMLFEAEIATYGNEEQQVIARYRDLSQQLANYGINESNMTEEYQKAVENVTRLETTQREIEELKTKYKNISRLKYNYGLATNDKFVYGSEYNKSKDEKNPVEITEDKTQRDEEDKRIEKEEKQNRHRVTDPMAFAFSDRYFDSTHRDL